MNKEKIAGTFIKEARKLSSPERFAEKTVKIKVNCYG